MTTQTYKIVGGKVVSTSWVEETPSGPVKMTQTISPSGQTTTTTQKLPAKHPSSQLGVSGAELTSIAHKGGGVLFTTGATYDVQPSKQFIEEQEKKMQQAHAEQQVMPQAETTYRKVGMEGSMVVIEKTTGKETTREKITEQKWLQMRKDYFARMTPEEKEASRLETRKAIFDAPVVEIGGKKYTWKEWREREAEVFRRADDPIAQAFYSLSKPISIYGGVIGGVLAGEGGLESVKKHWREEQVQIQRIMMYQPERRWETALTRSVEPALLGISLAVPQLPVIGAVIKKPIISLAISSGILGISTYEFVSHVPPALKQEITAERGRAVESMGMGVMGMTLGAYGIKRSWEAMFPAKVHVRVKTVGDAKALQKIDPDKKGFKGIKRTEIVGEAKIIGKKTLRFPGESIADYRGDIANKKMLHGLGQVETGIRTQDGKILRSTQLFKTKAGVMDVDSMQQLLYKKFNVIVDKKTLLNIFVGLGDKEIIYGQTVYGPSAGAKISPIHLRTKADTGIVKGGIDLTLKKIGSMAKLKSIETLTRIKQWYHGYPSETVSVIAGKDVKGVERTGIGTIELPGDSTSKIISSGRGLASKLDLKIDPKLTTGLSEVSTQIAKISAKNLIKSIVVVPKVKATTGVMPITATVPKVDTKKLSGVKLDTTVVVKAKTGTTTATRMDTATGTQVATRLDSGLATRLDVETAVGTRLDTRIGARLDTATGTRLDTMTITGPTITTITTPPPPPPPPPPVIPSLTLPGADFWGVRIGYGKRRKGIKRKYKPSLEASLERIYGKVPKTITGFGLRPIPRKTKRRKKRRRKRK